MSDTLLKIRKNAFLLTVAVWGFAINLLFSTSIAWAGQAGIPGGDEFLKGRRLQQSGNWAASIEHFRAAADVYSLIPDYALYHLSQSALQSGDTELATSSLEELFNRHPDTPIKRTARIELANLYFNTGKSAQAAPLLETILPGTKSTREIIELMLMLARSHAAADDFAKSDRICWQLIHGWPSSDEALDATGLVKDIDTARRRLAIAEVYSQNKKADEALAILDGLLDDPDAGDLMAEVLLVKAQSLEQKAQRKSASDLYDRIIAEYAESSTAATAYFNKGEYKRSLGLSDEALADYAQTAELFPQSHLAPQALWKRAKIFERADEPNQYIEYEKILRDYPRSPLAYSATMYWGVKLYQKRNYADAHRVFERLLAANLSADANANAAFWIGKCLVAEGKTDSAKVRLAAVIGTYENTYQAFRARSILQTLAEAQTIYTARKAIGWQDILAFDNGGYVPHDTDSPEKAYEAIEKELSHLKRDSLDRLRFLMLNRLSEAKWELQQLAGRSSGVNARYALARAQSQAQAHYDAIRTASSLSGKLDKSHAASARRLRYPLAYPELVGAKTSKYKVDAMLTLAVMREESHFREEIISGSDARGLMQILPRTGEWLAGKLFGPAMFDRSLLFRPAMNIELGSYYLRYLLDKFDDNVVLAIVAYNWGEGALSRWMGDSPPSDLDVFVETIPVEEPRRYVKKVLRSYAMYHSLYPPDSLSPQGS